MLVLYLVWGSTYLGIAIAVDTIPPFLMAAVAVPHRGPHPADLVGRARGRRAFLTPTRREWRDSAIVGTLLVGGGMGLVAFGEQTVPSGITALLVALMPLWVAISVAWFLGQRLPASRHRRHPRRFVGDRGILVGPKRSAARAPSSRSGSR